MTGSHEHQSEDSCVTTKKLLRLIGEKVTHVFWHDSWRFFFLFVKNDPRNRNGLFDAAKVRAH